MATSLKSDRISNATATSNLSSPSYGEMYFNTSDNRLYIYNSAGWGSQPFAPLGTSSNPATSITALATVTSNTSGVYYFDVGGAKQLYADFSQSHGKYVAVFRCENYANAGCTNNIWDFYLANQATTSGLPTSPTATWGTSGATGNSTYQSNARYLGFGGNDRNTAKGALGTTKHYQTWHTSTGTKFNGMYRNNSSAENHHGSDTTGTADMFYYFCNGPGSVNNPGAYSNSWMAAGNLDNGTAAYMYSHGYYGCNCCEGVYYNTGGWGSGNAPMCFGDGQQDDGTVPAWTMFYIGV